MDTEVARIEHLRLIQAVIDRMGRNSFAVRAASVTVTGALVAVSVTTREPLTTLGGLAIAPLWILDAYFLHTEREFRDLYNDVRKAAAPVPGSAEYFSLDRPHRRGGVVKGVGSAMLWRTLPLFYLPMVALLIVTGIAFATK